MAETNLEEKVRPNIGGAVSLGGFIVSINSYKWLRRAYVYPTNKGVAVGINF
jgi:hypothetical protein